MPLPTAAQWIDFPSTHHAHLAWLQLFFAPLPALGGKYHAAITFQKPLACPNQP
jgi:hypothetical protein